MTLSTRIGVMNAGEIVQVGEPSEIYEYPSSRFVADFIGTVNMFEGRVTEDEPDYIRIASPEAGGEIYVGHGVSCVAEPARSGSRSGRRSCRVTRERPDEAHNVFKAVVEEVAYLGNLSIYRLRLETGKVLQATKVNLVALRRRRHLLGRDGLGDLGRHRRRGADAMSGRDRAGAAAALDRRGAAPARARRARARHRGAAPLAPRLLPDPVPRRRQDQPQRGGDRHAALRAAPRMGRPAGDRHAQLRQLRLPLRRPALSQRLPLVAEDRLHLGGDRAPRRLSRSPTTSPAAPSRGARSC